MSGEREVDVLIAGAGPAGMTAALVASLQGLDVLLCEKSGQVGGTGATSAGTLWIPGNHQSRKAGFGDSAEKAQDYLDGLVGSAVNRDLRTAYLQTGPIAIDYLEDNSDVKFMPCGRHPDYRSNMKGAAVTGRAIAPQPFDGRLLGKDFARLRPPIREFMVFGGMMVGKADIAPLVGRFKSLANFRHAAKLFGRYLLDRTRYPRGTRLVMGNALVGRLFLSLKKRDVEILFDAPIADVVYENGRVLGAKIKIAGQEGRSDLREDAQGRRLCHGRLCAQQALPRRLHAAAGAGPLAEQRIQCRRRRCARASASAPASRRKNMAAADYGRRSPSRRAPTAARGFIRI